MTKGSWREFDGIDPKARPLEAKPITPKADRQVRVQRIRGGKRGKTVTLIKGLELSDAQLRLMLKNLKSRCGAGGTVKGDLLELQGDQIEVVLDFLIKEGYFPKQSGG